MANFVTAATPISKQASVSFSPPPLVRKHSYAHKHACFDANTGHSIEYIHAPDLDVKNLSTVKPTPSQHAGMNDHDDQYKMSQTNNEYKDNINTVFDMKNLHTPLCDLRKDNTSTIYFGIASNNDTILDHPFTSFSYADTHEATSREKHGQLRPISRNDPSHNYRATAFSKVSLRHLSIQQSSNGTAASTTQHELDFFLVAPADLKQNCTNHDKISLHPFKKSRFTLHLRSHDSARSA
eukprot:CAMPEP_0172482776 /NCGR_PEP_ID=MMETSP1066-20121228/9383_1 /TAXON_ID=671091 /ORGANISM="Coscinodiscus wailesii, Strain CCMP2513" /LENGTH=237 /DNA_ID=CAMNT_0013246179 /DNA_START=56 /DNA_END=769 /DNA_ORIENTATION=-